MSRKNKSKGNENEANQAIVEQKIDYVQKQTIEKEEPQSETSDTNIVSEKNLGMKPNSEKELSPEEAKIRQEKLTKMIEKSFDEFVTANTIGQDKFVLISSKVKGTYQSAVIIQTYAMEIKNVGCVIERVHSYGNDITTSSSFVPGVMIMSSKDGEGNEVNAIKPLLKR